MCCCNNPSVNGRDPYSWDGKSFSVRKPQFPEIEEGDLMLRELPGRCGNRLDSHSYDFRIVRRYGSLYLLVHHGGGQERINLRMYGLKDRIEGMDEAFLYWFLLEIYHAQSDARQQARDAESARWRIAAAEKRIKTRRQRNSNLVKVWIEAPKQEAVTV